MLKFKKIVALGVGLVALSGALMGCTSQELVDANAQLTSQAAQQKTSIDNLNTENSNLKSTIQNNNGVAEEYVEKVKELNDKVTNLESDKKTLEEEAERDAQVIADYEVEEIKEVEERTILLGGYEIDELIFGESIGDIVLDDSDIEKLQDKEIEFNDVDYDIHEELLISSDVKIEISGLNNNEDFNDKPYITLGDESALEYKYVFDDGIERFINKNNEKPLEINFLGQDVAITKLTPTSFTIREGEKYFIKEGESIKYGDRTITIDAVSGDSAFITVSTETEGQSSIVEKDVEEDIKGVSILLTETFSRDFENSGFVTVFIGEDIVKTIDNGDEYLEDSNYIYSIESTSNIVNSIGVKLEEYAIELDDDLKPITVGESYVLPNDFLTFEFSEITDVEYVTYTLSFKDNGLEIKTVDYNIIVNGEETKEVDIKRNSSEYIVTYKDNDGDKFSEVKLNSLVLENDETEYVINIGENITFSNLNDLKIETTTDLDNLKNIYYKNISIKGNDYDTLLVNGDIVVNPDNYEDNDKVKLKIPSEKVETTVKIY